jgi:transposase
MPKTGSRPVELHIQIFSLTARGIETKKIAAALEVPIRTIHDMIRRAKGRGFKPSPTDRIRMEFVVDAKRSGRPKEITPEIGNIVIQSVTKDRVGREKASEILAFGAGISHSSVLRILKRHGFVIAKALPGSMD